MLIHCMLVLQRVGKTFAFQTLQRILIKGTWQEYAYATPKANAAPGKEYDLMLQFYEEAPPSMMGVNAQANGKAAATNGTDAENILKLLLTRGKLVARVLQIGEDGARKT